MDYSCFMMLFYTNVKARLFDLKYMVVYMVHWAEKYKLLRIKVSIRIVFYEPIWGMCLCVLIRYFKGMTTSSWIKYE